MLTARNALDIISGGESTTVEFKKKVNTPSKIAKEIAAMANSKGGYLFIGVEDNGKICGIFSEKSDLQQVRKATSFYTLPNVPVETDVINLKGKDILIVKIPDSDQKPHYLIVDDPETKRTEKKIFIRMGEKSVPASREMSRLLKEQNDPTGLGVSIGIGENEKRLFRYLERYEKVTVTEFAKLVNISKRRSERSLINLVRAGVLSIHNNNSRDYFTMIAEPEKW
ncbi:MAG: hypothetical protein Kapaf2KO_13770 [Candidatus Kapaibacteriales bacterium]